MREPIEMDLCVPRFGYAVPAATRTACAQALAHEVQASAADLAGVTVGRVEVYNACCLTDRDLEHVFAAVLRTCDLTGAYRVAHVAPEQLSTGLLASLRNFHVDMYRIDVGSLNPVEFHALHRGYGTSVHAILARVLDAYAMDNWCAEVDLGIPRQTDATFEDALSRLLELGPGAVLVRMRPGGERFTLRLRERLGEAGFAQLGGAQLEGALYARPQFARLARPVGGWPGGVWGFGPGAASVPARSAQPARPAA